LYTHERSDPMLGESAISPVTVRTRHKLSRCEHQLGDKLVLTIVVCANLESLVAPHDETNFLRLFVFEESHISSTSFLPFRRVGNESEELGAPVIMACSFVESGGTDGKKLNQ